MNKEDFVTYEQALLLKKLGFGEKCLYYYDANAQIVANERNYQEEVSVKDLYTSYNKEYTSSNRKDAPTLAQAQKWLRKERCIDIDIDTVYYIGIRKYKFECASYKEKPIFYIEGDEKEEYEEALSAGITECLKLLEKKD